MASRGEGDGERSRLAAPVGERKCFSLQNLKIKVSGHSLLSSHSSFGLSVLVQSSLLAWGRGGFLQLRLISYSLPPLSLLSLIKYFERKQMGML